MLVSRHFGERAIIFFFETRFLFYRKRVLRGTTFESQTDLRTFGLYNR